MKHLERLEMLLLEREELPPAGLESLDWLKQHSLKKQRATPARQLNSFHLYQCHSLPALRRSPVVSCD